MIIKHLSFTFLILLSILTSSTNGQFGDVSVFSPLIAVIKIVSAFITALDSRNPTGPFINFLPPENSDIFFTWRNQFFPVLISTILPNSFMAFINVIRELNDVEPRLIIDDKPRGMDYTVYKKFPPCETVNRLFLWSADLATVRTWPDFLTSDTKAKFYVLDSNLDNRLTLNFDSPLSEFQKVKDIWARGEPAFVICHGWLDRYYEGGWMDKTAKLIDSKRRNQNATNGSTRRANILIVDWSQQSLNFFINKVAANSRTVGLELKIVLTNLLNLKIIDESTSIIGHSYGAQIGGFAGHILFRDENVRLRKVVALDPTDHCLGRDKAKIYAGVFSTKSNANSRGFNLSPLSATSVLTIHTDGILAGSYRRDSNTDVYVDGGGYQKACFPAVRGFVNAEAFAFLILCSHIRITLSIHQDLELTNADPTKQCQPVAYSCDAYGDFKNGKCDTCDDCGCQLAGLYSQIGSGRVTRFDQPPISGFGRFRDLTRTGKWYIQQDATPPYCLYHYSLKMISEAAPEAVFMSLELFGQNRTYAVEIDLSVSSSILFTHPVIDGFQGPFERIDLHYIDFPSQIIGVPFQFFITGIQIHYMSNLNPEVRKMYTSTVCPDNIRGNGARVNHIINSVTVTLRREFCQNNLKVYHEQFDSLVKSRLFFNHDIVDDYAGCVYNCRATKYVIAETGKRNTSYDRADGKCLTKDGNVFEFNKRVGN